MDFYKKMLNNSNEYEERDGQLCFVEELESQNNMNRMRRMRRTIIDPREKDQRKEESGNGRKRNMKWQWRTS